MKIKETSPGKVYALDSMNGCEVMNGNVVVQVPAMTQTIVIANSDCLTSEDDTVTITEVFKLAPALYRQGEDGGNWMKEAYDGLVSIVGADNFKWEFLDNPYRVVVHTDRLDDTQLAAVTALLERVLPENLEVVQYNHHIEVSWRDINKYAECVTRADFLAVNPDYLNDLTSDGEWVYPTDSMSSGHGIFWSGWLANPMFYFYAKKITGRTLVTEMHSSYFGGMPQCTHVTFEAPNLTRMSGQWLDDSMKVKYVKLFAPKLKEVAWMLWGNNNGEIEFDGELPSLNNCNIFVGRWGYLSVRSAIKVLNSLPAYTSGTHKIGTFSVHTDGQTDEDMIAALNSAGIKGWTIEVQWLGTPTASTLALRPAQTLPVYAKVGSFADVDENEHPMLNWCHLITSPEGKTPEELGYTRFDSVEAAREYFNLPEEEEETIIEEQ